MLECRISTFAGRRGVAVSGVALARRFAKGVAAPAASGQNNARAVPGPAGWLALVQQTLFALPTRLATGAAITVAAESSASAAESAAAFFARLGLRLVDANGASVEFMSV